MKAYSIDLQERVLWAVDHGNPRSEIVKMLGVSLATIKRYLKQRRETGHVRSKAIPGRTARKGAALQAGLVAPLKADPDVSLQREAEVLSHIGARFLSFYREEMGSTLLITAVTCRCLYSFANAKLEKIKSYRTTL